MDVMLSLSFSQASKCWQIELHRNSRSLSTAQIGEGIRIRPPESPGHWSSNKAISNSCLQVSGLLSCLPSTVPPDLRPESSRSHSLPCSTQVKPKVCTSLTSSHINVFLIDSKVLLYWKAFLFWSALFIVWKGQTCGSPFILERTNVDACFHLCAKGKRNVASSCRWSATAKSPRQEAWPQPLVQRSDIPQPSVMHLQCAEHYQKDHATALILEQWSEEQDLQRYRRDPSHSRFQKTAVQKLVNATYSQNPDYRVHIADMAAP